MSICVNCEKFKNNEHCEEFNICEYELTEREKQIKADVCKEIYDLLDAGICPLCEHSEDNCFKWCGEQGYEIETLKTWLEAKIKEHKSLK